MVPASRAVRARPDPDAARTPSLTWRGAGSTSCRSRARSSSLPPTAGGRRSLRQRESCRCTTARRLPRTGTRAPVAHGLRAHLHVRDAWAEPAAVDAVFNGLRLSFTCRGPADEFLGVVRRWLRPGGTFAFIDRCPTNRAPPPSGAADDARYAASMTPRVHDRQGLLRAARSRPRLAERVCRRPRHDDRPLLPDRVVRAGRGYGGRAHPPDVPPARSTIVTVGSGVMAEAMIAGMLRALVEPDRSRQPSASRATRARTGIGVDGRLNTEAVEVPT